MDSGTGLLDTNPEPELPFTFNPESSRSNSALPSLQRSWRPEPGAGQFIGAALSLGGLLLTAIVAQRASNTDGAVQVGLWIIDLLLFASSCVAVFLLWQLRSIRYLLADDALVIAMTGRRIEIPFYEITSVAFRPRDVIDFDGYERIWPGYYNSRGSTSDGLWRSVATTAPHGRVRIYTRGGVAIAVSPHRPVLFVETLEFLRTTSTPVVKAFQEDDDEPPNPAGLTVLTEPAMRVADAKDHSGVDARRYLQRPAMPFAYRILRERIVRGDPVASRLLALSLLVLIVLVFIAAWKVDSVIQPLAVKWNPSGEPIWFARPDGFWLIDGVWIYPVTAAAIVGVNTALATLAASFGRMFEVRLLLSGSFIAAGIVLVAMIRTTGLF